MLFADLLFCPRQAFGDRRFGCKKRLCDFGGTERAQRFEGERGLIFRRHYRMAAGEHQSETVVSDFGFERWRFAQRGFGRPLFHECDDLWLFVMEKLFAPDNIKREILGCLREPGRWILGNSRVGPCPECPD